MYTQSALSAEERRRRRRRNKLLGLVASVLVAALAVVALVVVNGNRTPGKPGGKPSAAGQGRLDIRETVEKRPANTTGVMAFRFSSDDLTPGEAVEMPGMWATDKILAKGIRSTLAGFRIGTDASPGEEVWRLRLSGPICGYTRHVTGDHRTAVLSRESRDEDAPCNRVTFVDLDDGQKIWENVFPLNSDDVRRPSVTLTRATVAVTWGRGSEAYDMDEGRRLWRTKATGRCWDAGAAGGRALLVRVQCLHHKQSPNPWETTTYRVRKVDPRTGRVLWTYPVAAGVRDVRVPSADPAVLAVSAGENGFTELLSLDGQGRRRATISLRNTFYVGECNDEYYLVLDDCQTISVGNGQVFLRSEEVKGSGLYPSNWIIGFDLATGHTTEKFESGPNALLYPLRMSGDQLLGLRMSEDRISPSALVVLDPRTGAETPYFYFGVPLDGELLTHLKHNDVVVQDGRLFFGTRRAERPADGKEKSWEWLVLGMESGARRK
ncbi:PQQ-binding-like beta-propeller repeat protein [Streptomyces thermoalcalitolerans]|uniref:PQQ-binding-like beta-propeller repeat protein n=2 Tax=Streptomyces thermoalcalitolerans TaxID=65605 RepID=A0ABN1PLE3_9ACTN